MMLQQRSMDIIKANNPPSIIAIVSKFKKACGVIVAPIVNPRKSVLEFKILSETDFDPGRDIAGITVNRWPHGYAWTPNPIFNGEFEEGDAPNEIGRQPFGRIHIANSDAGAKAYLDCAIDEAYRAVSEI